MSENYKIRIKKGDFELEVSGDKDFTTSKFDELSKILDNASTSQSNNPPIAISHEVPRSITLVEFLKKKEANGHPDRIVIFAYYLFHNRKIESFNVDDIEACYSETRTGKPANINDAINQSVGKGHLTPATEKKNDKKAWTITQTGDEYVEKDLTPLSGN